MNSATSALWVVGSDIAGSSDAGWPCGLGEVIVGPARPGGRCQESGVLPGPATEDTAPMDFQASVDRVERELVRLGGHGLDTATWCRAAHGVLDGGVGFDGACWH